MVTGVKSRKLKLTSSFITIFLFGRGHIGRAFLVFLNMCEMLDKSRFGEYNLYLVRKKKLEWK